MEYNTSLPASVRDTFDRYIAERDFGDSHEAELALREAATEMAKVSPMFAALVLSRAPSSVIALMIASQLGYSQITVQTIHSVRTITNTNRTLFGQTIAFDQSDVTKEYGNRQTISLEKRG